MMFVGNQAHLGLAGVATNVPASSAWKLTVQGPSFNSFLQFGLCCLPFVLNLEQPLHIK